MSGKWPEVALGEVVRHRKEFIRIDDTAEYKRCRVQLHAKGVVLRDVVSGAQIKTKSQQVCRAGEFLVAEIDAKVGGYGIVPPGLDGAVASSHYFLFSIDEQRIDRRFLGYFIRTRTFFDQVGARGSTNYAAVRPNEVLRYRIPLPPLPEQRRIVEKIERVVRKTGEVSVLSHDLSPRVARLASVGTASKLRRISPDQWRCLGDCVSIRGGSTPAKDNPAFWGGDIPWVCPRDMKAREIHGSTTMVTQSAINGSKGGLVAPGTVLVVVRGMILVHTFPVAVLRVPATMNQDMKALQPKDDLLPEYLYSVLWALNPEIVSLVERSGHDTRKLVTDKLLDFRIPVPALIAQRRIVAHLDALQAKVDALKQEQSRTSSALNALLPSVLDRAFRGKL